MAVLGQGQKEKRSWLARSQRMMSWGTGFLATSNSQGGNDENRISLIKADIGSIGGHIRPSEKLIQTVKNYVATKGSGFVSGYYVSFTGDDIAILFSHALGKGSEKIHHLAWDAFVAGTQVAKQQGLYGAGQDLLKDSFSGDLKRMGLAVA
jgi:fructose 1,6-bisphosphate aldolase/phosphatase